MTQGNVTVSTIAFFVNHVSYLCNPDIVFIDGTDDGEMFYKASLIQFHKIDHSPEGLPPGTTLKPAICMVLVIVPCVGRPLKGAVQFLLNYFNVEHGNDRQRQRLFVLIQLHGKSNGIRHSSVLHIRCKTGMAR